jgi:hypothetical protein
MTAAADKWGHLQSRSWPSQERQKSMFSVPLDQEPPLFAAPRTGNEAAVHGSERVIRVLTFVFYPSRALLRMSEPKDRSNPRFASVLSYPTFARKALQNEANVGYRTPVPPCAPFSTSS